MTPPRRWTIPRWAIIWGGIVATGAAIIYAGGLHDTADGTPLIDGPIAQILLALIGGAVTLLSLLLQRTGDVEHELKPNSGTSMRDSTNRTETKVDRTERKIDALVAAVEHLERAHRKNSSDIEQLREDHQQTRTDLSGQAADTRGIRKDLGRIADVITKKETP